MKKTFIRRALSALLCLALLCGTLGLTACADKGETLLSLEGNTLTVNEYQFLLSRVKGTLSYAGYSVDSADFWEMVVDSNGTTYDEYFRQTALNDARRYLAAMVLFEEEGLILPRSYTDKIDEEIDEYIRDAGSKSAFNATLSAYGINVDMLRNVYVMEAKYEYLQAHLYGADGSKVAPQVKQDYLTEHAVCFRQLLIRAFDYVYEVDLNGDEIYYKTDENNAKVNNVAYDSARGSARLDEYGKTIVDKNGDTVYFLPDGKIAYDTEEGVRAMTYDENGYAKTVPYSKEELAEHKAAAEELVAAVTTGDYAAFESMLEEFSVSGDDAFITEDDYYFLYTTGDNSYDYLNDIADTLAEAPDGTVAMVSSEYGYNVVMKYPMPEDAATNASYEEWFPDLSDRVIAKLFHNKCASYMEKVEVSDEAFSSMPSMKEIGTNKHY